MSNKYDGADFNDPVIRCDQCSKITHRKFIEKYGGCCHCGNKRFSNVTAILGEEYTALKSGEMDIGIEKPYEIDPEFFDVFEPAPEVV